MKQTRKFVESLGFPSTDSYDLPTSAKRFPMVLNIASKFPALKGRAACRP